VKETEIDGRAEALKAISLLTEPGQVIELRALHVKRGKYINNKTYSGYFNDPQKLIDAALDITPFAVGTYFMPNPIKPELLARRNNKFEQVGYEEKTTADHEILARKVLIIDLDSEREPKDISATPKQVKKALERAGAVREYLSENGWPEPIYAMTGNGARLWYKIDEPTDDKGLVGECLEALKGLFSDAEVKIDTTTQNPARIDKLPGTWARKADELPELGIVHRQARILEHPDSLEVVAHELLVELASNAPKPEPVKRAPKPKNKNQNGKFYKSPYDLRSREGLEHWIRDAGFEVSKASDYRGKLGMGYRWELKRCPVVPEHNTKPAHIIWFDNAGISAGCAHDSCSWNWQDLRMQYEPGWTPFDETISSGDGHSGQPPEVSFSSGNVNDTHESADSADVETHEDDLSDVHFYGGVVEAPPPQEFILEDHIPEGHVSILAGSGGSGKSTFAMYMTFCIALGQRFLGLATKKSTVLYVDFELDKDTFDRRAISLANGMNRRGDVPPGVAYWRTKQFMTADEESKFFVQLEKRLDRFGFDMIVIDSFTMGSAGTDNIESSSIIAILQRLAELPVTVLCLDHIPHAASHMREDANPFGSVFKKNAARSILTLFKDKDSEVHTFSKGKANFAGKTDPIDYAMTFALNEDLPLTGKYNSISFHTLDIGFKVAGQDAIDIVESYISEHGTCPSTSDIVPIAGEKDLGWAKGPSLDARKKKAERYLKNVSKQKKEAAYDQGKYLGLYTWKDGRHRRFTTYAFIGGSEAINNDDT